MKIRILFSFALSFLAVAAAIGQNVSARTNEFEVDFSDPATLAYTTIPVINWVSPVAETNYAQEMKFKIEIEIQSDKPIKNVTIFIKESELTASRGMTTVKPEAGQEKYPFLSVGAYPGSHCELISPYEPLPNLQFASR